MSHKLLLFLLHDLFPGPSVEADRGGPAHSPGLYTATEVETVTNFYTDYRAKISNLIGNIHNLARVVTLKWHTGEVMQFCSQLLQKKSYLEIWVEGIWTTIIFLLRFIKNSNLCSMYKIIQYYILLFQVTRQQDLSLVPQFQICSQEDWRLLAGPLPWHLRSIQLPLLDLLPHKGSRREE